MQEQPRILALDVGTKTIGVAVSDPLGITAQAVETIRRQSVTQDLAQLQRLVQLYNPERFVVGYPLSMSGAPGPQAQFVETFVEHLRGLELPIDYIDERLTTKQAATALIATGMRRDKRKAVIDQQAAVLILQSYLDRRSRRQAAPDAHQEP
ncbi:Holliday junction resolvase RuvX [bacterium]|nr:Holliday junction resolvase RuvX [bacterium]